MQAELEKYAQFVETTLRPQLTDALARRDALNEQIQEYENLVEMVQDKIAQDAKDQAWKLQADLGKQCFVKVKVPPQTQVVVHIGLQVFVEMKADEVPKFVKTRVQVLQAQREQHQTKAREIASHIQQVLDSIEQLAKLQQLEQSTN
ncbi:unnamed protein product [Aphanomyces euteiches]|uniref:Prefoldin, alpha subunit n=1 Tax=Aphanomyces euteiches TaxID=100861 RepID=A0A6G0XWJ7_9STRA|nr:hypothetical protein Ae201684_000746 [Aphanomyces euteiches]KAH9099970.1 hypothetical protein Ae201684P_018976 [Aphanomyces euteiches]KAH9124793.1 hypothetical protein AeMF1_004495 [Aphanomyces euteiches]KAH9151887.1 hypothetical protein AeRB84_005612 [Aphanomyces euteiches]KAH9190066.1 hypothetical protein AeNC1_007957 [Aphanomyces euteiches]